MRVGGESWADLPKDDMIVGADAQTPRRHPAAGAVYTPAGYGLA